MKCANTNTNYSILEGDQNHFNYHQFWESGFENAASAGLSAGLDAEFGAMKFPNPMLKQAFQTDIPRAELYALGMQGARMAYYRGGKVDWKSLLIAALQAPVNQAIGDFSPQTEALQNKLQEPNWRVQIPSEFADSVISGAVYKHKLSWEDLEMDAADALGSYGGNFAAIEGYKQLSAHSQAMDQRAQTQWKNQSSQAKKAQANNPNLLDQLSATTQTLNKESQKINDELAALGKINPFTGERLDSGVTSGSDPSRVRQTQSGAPNDPNANNINKNPSYTNRQAQHDASKNQAQAQSNFQQQQTSFAAKGSSRDSFWNVSKTLAETVGGTALGDLIGLVKLANDVRNGDIQIELGRDAVYLAENPQALKQLAQEIKAAPQNWVNSLKDQINTFKSGDAVTKAQIGGVWLTRGIEALAPGSLAKDGLGLFGLFARGAAESTEWHVGRISAEEVNEGFITVGKKPPYRSGSWPRDLVLTEGKEEEFVRLYDGKISQEVGNWIMRKEALLRDLNAGLTPEQLANKYALPAIPKFVSDVKLDPNAALRVGYAGPQSSWGRFGGGIQYELRTRLQLNAFTNGRTLDEFFSEIFNTESSFTP